MGAYVLNMLFALLVVGGLAIGSLWLWKKLQSGGGAALFGARPQPALRLRSAVQLGVNSKLIVVEFAGRQMLLAATRQGVSLIADTVAEGDAPESVDNSDDQADAAREDFSVMLERVLTLPPLSTANTTQGVAPPSPRATKRSKA